MIPISYRYDVLVCIDDGDVAYTITGEFDEHMYEQLGVACDGHMVPLLRIPGW